MSFWTQTPFVTIGFTGEYKDRPSVLVFACKTNGTSDQEKVNRSSRRKNFQSRCNHTHLNSSLSTFLARVIIFFIDDIKAASTGKELSSFPKTQANTTMSLIVWADITIWRPQIYISFPFRAVFKWLSKVITWLRLLGLVIGLKDAPVFQPMRIKNKTNGTMYTWFFPRFERVTGKC